MVSLQATSGSDGVLAIQVPRRPYSDLLHDFLGWGEGLFLLGEPAVAEILAALEAKLQTFIAENNLQAFPQVLVTPQFDLGLNHLLQTSAVGPLKPNLVVWGWSDDPARALHNVHNLRTAHALHMSQIVLCNPGLPAAKRRKRIIDIWWRGKHNGSLMVILAYLISLNGQWAGSKIRILPSRMN